MAAKKDLSKQLQILESYINDIPMIFDPCKNCKFIDDNKKSHINNTEICSECCWYYSSNFQYEMVRR